MSGGVLGDVLQGVVSPSFDTEFRHSQALSVAAVDEAQGLAERLKAVRRRLGLRQLDVARELGIRRQTLALIEIDRVAGADLRGKVCAWLEAREAAIAAEDRTAGPRDSEPPDAGPPAAPETAAGEGSRRRRRRGRGRARPSPGGRSLAPSMMAAAVLRRRIERESRKAEAAWRKRQARRGRLSTLGLLLQRI